MPTLSLITAILPELSEHVGETQESVKAARNALIGTGWNLEWVVAIDGPGRHPDIGEAEKVLTLPKHCGVSAARNYALSKAAGDWIAPLDGDDMVDGPGLANILEHIRSPEPAGWIGANRLLIDGGRTPHWKTLACEWHPGALAMHWEVPFAFHPNSVLVQRDLALRIGGWPAVPCNEDLALLLMLSEESMGRFTPNVLGRYRVWGKQAIAQPDYADIKQCGFDVIERTINAGRESHGRPPIEAPRAQGAIGGLRHN